MSYPEPPTGSPASSTAAQDRSLRIMALAFLTMTVVFGVLLDVAEGTPSTNALYFVLGVLVVVLGFVLALNLGYRSAPVAARRPGAPDEFTAAFFRRLAMTETPVFINLAIGFLAGSALPYFVAWPFAVASMAFHLIPSAGMRRRWEAAQQR